MRRRLATIIFSMILALGVSAPAFAVVHHVDTGNGGCQEIASGKDVGVEHGVHKAHNAQDAHKPGGHIIHHGECGSD